MASSSAFLTDEEYRFLDTLILLLHFLESLVRRNGSNPITLGDNFAFAMRRRMYYDMDLYIKLKALATLLVRQNERVAIASRDRTGAMLKVVCNYEAMTEDGRNVVESWDNGLLIVQGSPVP